MQSRTTSSPATMNSAKRYNQETPGQMCSEWSRGGSMVLSLVRSLMTVLSGQADVSSSVEASPSFSSTAGRASRSVTISPGVSKISGLGSWKPGRGDSSSMGRRCTVRDTNTIKRKIKIRNNLRQHLTFYILN